MKCAVCGYEKIEKGRGVCPVCKFPVLYMATDNDEKVKELIFEYKKKNLNNIRIYLNTYQYKMEEDNLVLGNIESIRLAVGDELKKGQIQWYNQKFARVDEKILELSIKVNKFSLESEEKIVQINTPEIEGLWKVGIVLSDEFKVQIVVGNEKNYKKSEEIELF